MATVIESGRPIAVSTSEAARLAGVSQRTIRSHIVAKRLPAKKIGRRRLVMLSDLESWLDSNGGAVSRGL